MLRDRSESPALIIRFADGRRFRVTDTSVSDVLLNAVFLRFYAFSMLGWAMVGTPLPFDAPLDSAQFSVIWGALSSAGLIWLFIAASLARLAHRIIGLKSIYTPFLTMPAVTLAPLVANWIAAQLGLDLALSDTGLLSSFVKAAVFVLVLDVFFGSYVAPFHSGLFNMDSGDKPDQKPAGNRDDAVFPSAQGEIVLPDDDLPSVQPPKPLAFERKSVTPPPENDIARPAHEILVAGERFDAEDILFMRSDDHYLNVVTRNRRLLLRGRLGDALQQVPTTAGIQINRSAWVAFSGISHVEGDDARQQLVVKLVTGEEERVAQSRRHALLAAMSLHRDQMA